ncbi:MAG: TonB-dependent receptor, partial [Sphingobacteriales bacterium]
MKPMLQGMLVCLSLWPLAAAGQAPCVNRVKLTIVEVHDFTPVHPALIYIEELRRSWETSESGAVSLDSLCNGTYTVHIHGSGYEDKIEKITVNGNASIRLKAAFREHHLQDVTVNEEAAGAIIQSKENLNQTAVRRLAGESLSSMLEHINGVTTLGTGGTIGKPVIHGLHSNRVAMLNNGIRQEDQQWGGEHAPNIDPFLAGQVSVIKGAAGVRYGTDAMGGVVLVEPPPLRAVPGWSGELNLAGFSNNRMGAASLMVDHNLPKIPALSFRLQGSIRKGGNYRIPGYWAANTGLEEQNYAAAVAWRRLHYGAELSYSHFGTALGIYRGSHTGSEADLMAAITSPVPLVPAGFSYKIERPRQQVSHDLVKLKLYADNRQGMWQLVYGVQKNFRQEYDVQRIENDKAQLNLTLITQTLNLNLRHKPIGRLSGEVGLDGTWQDNRFRDGDRLFIPTYRAYGAAAYAIERFKLGQSLVEAGIRYDLKRYNVINFEGSNQQMEEYRYGFGNLSATAGIRRSWKPDGQWAFTVAHAWRTPQANELFSAGLHHGAARIELGNKSLKPEKALGANFDISNR